jgi:ribose-phosphate pyrophosphokinase
MVVMEKKRFLYRHDQSESYQIIGDIQGADAIVIDDVISTGGTIANSAISLVATGAASVTVLATHGVLAGKATELLSHTNISRVILSDTINISKEKQTNNMEIVSTAPIIAESIQAIVG